MIAVRDTDVHHWLWRLRAFRTDCPGTPWAATAAELTRSVRREAVGLYVDASIIRVPADLARAVLAALDAAAACCPATALAEDARADGALLELALLAA